MRLVLDSNVWLDWLHFDDPRVTPLKHAKRDGDVEIVIDAPCRDELTRVLAYDRFGLNAQTQAAMLADVDRLSVLLENSDYPSERSLPYCSDPDDVKFLALAAVSGADWLITKDKALLGKRRRRTRESIPYRIGTPEQWLMSETESGS